LILYYFKNSIYKCSVIKLRNSRVKNIFQNREVKTFSLSILTDNIYINMLILKKDFISRGALFEQDNKINLYYILYIHTFIYFIINKNTAAIFANNNFLVHLNVKLALRRYFIKATPTSISFNGNNRKSVF